MVEGECLHMLQIVSTTCALLLIQTPLLVMLPRPNSEHVFLRLGWADGLTLCVFAKLRLGEMGLPCYIAIRTVTPLFGHVLAEAQQFCTKQVEGDLGRPREASMCNQYAAVCRYRIVHYSIHHSARSSCT